MNEVEAKSSRRKFLVKIVKVALVTAIYGVVWFLIWLLLSSFLGNFFLQFSALYWILVCASLFFTFAIRISENTIYKYVFIILRSFFLIVYIAYSTNFGVLSMDYAGFTFTVEFIPLLAIMVAINLLSIARGLIQAIEFSAQSPED